MLAKIMVCRLNLAHLGDFQKSQILMVNGGLQFFGIFVLGLMSFRFCLFPKNGNSNKKSYLLVKIKNLFMRLFVPKVESLYFATP
jgi:hypothetical protein